LLLGIPVNRELVQEMKNGSDGLACNNIMIQVRIVVVCCCDGLTQRLRSILRNILARVSIDGFAPIILSYLYVREIGFISEYAKFSKAELIRNLLTSD
jgi:hypothetical protein